MCFWTECSLPIGSEPLYMFRIVMVTSESVYVLHFSSQVIELTCMSTNIITLIAPNILELLKYSRTEQRN